MADLLARFKLVDEMSDKLGDMAESGQNMVEQWEQAGEAANATFEGIAGTVTTAASSIDGVATSIDSVQGAASGAASSADELADSINGYGDAATEAAAQTDYWTDAVGNYDKSALEAVYSTEELVEMGLKSAEALEEQERMFELCDQSASSLSKSIEATSDITSELSKAMDEAASMSEELSDNDKVSAETKAEFAKASTDAAEAMSELSKAQQEAEEAMAAYDAVMTSGTDDLDTLEAAAERASSAAENLAEANGKASEATEELSKATEKAADEEDNAKKSGVEMAEGIAGALAAAGITAMVKEVATEVYNLAEAFSEAESTVVKATGASGEALDDLTTSMMNAYATSKSASLDDTAGAIGEINTRMGLTGEALTTVTGQFLDFAEITGTDVVGSVQNVTKVMNKWGVEGSDVESVLDKLAYAGQISGASVDSLSSTLISGSSVFQQAGMSLDNAISLLSDFELYGISSTTAVTALRTAINGFADDGLDAQDALAATIEEIANMENASDATALAVETFGSRAGVEMASAIRNGAVSVDSLSKSLEEADGTLEKTAATAQTLDQKWTQASNNISTAFTTAVQPTLDGISSAFASVANGFGTFLNEHPAVTKAITAIGVGLGTAVVAIGAVAAASLTAIPAVAALGTAISAAIWPITAIAAGVAAVVGVVLLLADAFSAAEDETAGMTATTREQYYELQDLNSEYEEACAKYGENSEEALRLKYQVDDLTAAFEANRQTVEEFTAEVDSLCESVSAVTDDFNSALTEINSQETGTLALIQKYEDLATQAELTGAQQKELEAVTKKLTDTYPDLAAQLDSTTASAEDYVDAMKKACEQEAEEQRQQQAQETYVDALAKRAELTEEIAKAQENVNLEQARMDDMSGWTHFWTAGEWDDLEAYQAALDELNAANAENEATIAEIEQGWADIADAEAEAADATVSWEDAATTAFEEVQDKVVELCEAYGEAYNAALESFEGQFGLFDEASMKSDDYLNATVENAQAALDSQLAYWEEYNANLETLTSYGEGLTGEAKENYEALVEYAQSGSEEAAGLASSIADAIESGDEDAINSLASTLADVQSQQETAAAQVADFVTDFSGQMDELEKEMQDTVDNMNLDDEAAASATATIQSYADAIRAGKGNAVAAAEEVANAVSAAFSAAKTTVSVNVSSSGSVAGHANGTTNAENAFIAGEEGPELIARPAAAYANGTTDSTDYFIAGENGPELIVGEQGSTVFPTEETDRIISALNGLDEPTAAYAQTSSFNTTNNYDNLVENYDQSQTSDVVNNYETAAPTEETDRIISALNGLESRNEQPLQILENTDTSDGRENASEQVKRILLEIAGSGAIEISGNGGSVDKESILEVLYDHLKPVLMNIIQGEIYEEGELSYEF